MNGDPVRFTAVVEPLAWGRNVYTVLTVPDRLVRAAAALSTRRVEGTLDEEPVNVGLNRADVVPDTFVYLGRPLLRRLGARPGDVVECVLRPADPDHVPVPDDVARALERAGGGAAFERLPAPQRRRLLAPVETAARPATRAQRIERLVAELGAT